MDGCFTDGPCQLVTTTHGGTTYLAAGQSNYAANIAETAAEVLGIPVQVDPPVPVGPTTTATPSAPSSSTSAPATAASPAARPVAGTPAFTG
jgi:hypothetical protein